MANTYTKITTVSLSTTAANIDFSSIPATYTDLLIKISSRCDTASQDYFALDIALNGSSASFTTKQMFGVNATAYYGSGAYRYVGYTQAVLMTANAFASGEIYIPNYANTSYVKSISADSVTETNAVGAVVAIHATTWSNTAAINQITLTPDAGGNFVAYTTATLYGINNS